MNARHCCQIVAQDREDARRPASLWRRGGEFAGWIIPSATLVLLPKCPICVATYVALFSGIGISVASASCLRTSMLILCGGTLLWLAVKSLCRLASGNRARWMTQTPEANGEIEIAREARKGNERAGSSREDAFEWLDP